MAIGAVVAASLLGALSAGPARAESVLLEAGAPTTYLANTSDPGVDATWFLEEFVEGPEWSAGSFGVGYEGAPPGAAALIETTVPGPVNSLYTRTTFHVDNVDDVFSLFIGFDYDDGVVAWINGVEVYRSWEMVNRPTAWDTISAGHESSNGSAPDYAPLRDISAVALPLLRTGDNLLAIGIWNQGGMSDDLVLVPQLVADRLLSRGPYLQLGTAGGVTVRWRTTLPQGSRVQYGTDPLDLSQSSVAGTPTLEHEIAISGLQPSTRYYYAVGSPSEVLAGGDAEHYFDTPPPAGTATPTRICG